MSRVDVAVSIVLLVAGLGVALVASDVAVSYTRALAALLGALEARLAEPPEATLRALRDRDALHGRPVRWEGGTGTGAGIAGDGALRVRDATGAVQALAAGEVHLV